MGDGCNAERPSLEFGNGCNGERETWSWAMDAMAETSELRASFNSQKFLFFLVRMRRKTKSEENEEH